MSDEHIWRCECEAGFATIAALDEHVKLCGGNGDSVAYTLKAISDARIASARNDALEEAGLYHDTEMKKLQNAIFTLMLGQREQPLRDAIEHHEISAAGIRALKTKGGAE